MKKRIAELAHHRQRLLETIRAQRKEVAEITLQLHTPMAAFDMGVKAVRFMRHNPWAVTGSLVALLSLRGIGISGWLQRGWRLLYLYPAAISIGLKYVLSKPRSTGEVNDSVVDH